MGFLYSSKCFPVYYSALVSFSALNGHTIISSLKWNEKNLFLLLHTLNSLNLRAKLTYLVPTCDSGLCLYIAAN